MSLDLPRRPTGDLTCDMLTLVAGFDRREGWADNFASCAEWLAWRTGRTLAAARENVRVAHALAELPLTAEAMRSGQLSYTKARTMTRVATPETEATGRSELDGVRVCAETSRRMACDAARVAMGHRDGEVVSMGRRQRTIPPHIRRALEERDRGCRYPGCASRFTEAHHVKHWADGGETSLANTVLLCRRHHRLVHEGKTRMALDRDGKAAFFTRTGKVIGSTPPLQGAARKLPPPPAPPPNRLQSAGSCWARAASRRSPARTPPRQNQGRRHVRMGRPP